MEECGENGVISSKSESKFNINPSRLCKEENKHPADITPFLCSKCSMIPTSPLYCKKCNCLVCGMCRGDECPNCLATALTLEEGLSRSLSGPLINLSARGLYINPDPQLFDRFKTLKAYCKYKCNGCTHNPKPLPLLYNHEKQCKYMYNQCKLCKHMVLLNDMEHHLAALCPNIKVQCQVCKEVYIYIYIYIGL